MPRRVVRRPAVRTRAASLRSHRGPPRYVVLEGIDGAGKSELARALGRALVRSGERVTLLREPSDPVLRAEAERLAAGDPLAAAWCFTVDRALARPRLEAALSDGRIVLQDRGYFSTLAYQGSRLGVRARRELARIQRAVARPPDLVLWLDLPVATARRRRDRRGPQDRFEQELDLSAIRRAFVRQARSPEWVRLDATLSRGELLDSALRALRGKGA